MITRTGAILLYAFIFIAGLVVFSPTIVYLAATPSVFAFLSHDSPARALMGKMLYVGIPLVGWAISRARALRRVRQFQEKIAYIPTSTLGGPMPRDLVLEGSGGSIAFNLDKAVGVERIYEPAGGNDPAWNRIELKNRGKHIERERVESLPRNHLLLRCGRDSRFYDRKVPHGAGGGPFELSVVDETGERLLGLLYRPFIRIPMFPPLLTLHGWFSRPNASNTDQIRERVTQFVRSSLIKAGAELPKLSGS